jgi:hypothetical protein
MNFPTVVVKQENFKFSCFYRVILYNSMVNEDSESAQEKGNSATTVLSSSAAEEIQQSFNRPLRWFKISKLFK